MSDLRALIERVEGLTKAATDLVDSISFDDNGALIGGKWMGGNGGLLSRETIQKADAVRRAVASVRAIEASNGGRHG